MELELLTSLKDYGPLGVVIAFVVWLTKEYKAFVQAELAECNERYKEVWKYCLELREMVRSNKN